MLGKGGERIEVKCLANPRGRFINEHTILRGNWDQYALVCFEDLRPTWVLVFQEWGLALDPLKRELRELPMMLA